MRSAELTWTTSCAGVVATTGVQAKDEFITVPAKSCLITTTDQVCSPKTSTSIYMCCSAMQERLKHYLIHAVADYLCIWMSLRVCRRVLSRSGSIGSTGEAVHGIYDWHLYYSR
jgi:hypothetical protein